MVNFVFALVAVFCVGDIVKGAMLADSKEYHSKDDFSTVNYNINRTLKYVHKNVTLKAQIETMKEQIATLQIYKKKLGLQKYHLQVFKITLKSKINMTQSQTYKLVMLQKQIEKTEFKMVDISSKMKKLEAQMAAIQMELKSLHKSLKALYIENRQLTGRHISGKDCADLYKKGGRENGVYQIDPDGQGYFNVFCDMTSSSGGWTVFQRRQDGSVNFYRGWKDYKQGFGNLKTEFWLGLDKIHRLTSARRNKLRIDMGDTSENKKYAEFDYFAVKSEKDKYKLSLGKYSGTAGDSLSYNKGMAFSTKDSDNNSCAIQRTGAWWYRSCSYSNLNGHYYHGKYNGQWKGVVWYAWKGASYSLKFTEMKIKP